MALATLEKFGFEFHLRSSPSAFNGYGWSDNQLITSLLAAPCWQDPTRSKQLSTVAILDFHFLLVWTNGLLVWTLSWSSLSIFGRSYVNRQHFRLWSFASLCLDCPVLSPPYFSFLFRTPCTHPLDPPPTCGCLWFVFRSTSAGLQLSSSIQFYVFCIEGYQEWQRMMYDAIFKTER